MSMLRWWREYLIVGLIAVIAVGYAVWPERLPPTPASAVVKTDTQTKQIIHVVTTEPDGTITEKTTTTEKDTQVSSRTTDKSKYGVGVYIEPRTQGSTGYRDLRVDASARLGALPLFGVVGYEFKDKTIYAGIRAEF